MNFSEEPTWGPGEVEEFVATWLGQWNAHDVEGVLSHFSEDVVFTSLVARQLLDGSDGLIRGKAELREYWTHALRLVPDLRFELIGAYAGVATIVINYRNQKGALACEVLIFEHGTVVEGHGTYLAGAEDPAIARRT